MFFKENARRQDFLKNVIKNKFCDCWNHASPDITKLSNHSESAQLNLSQSTVKPYCT